jgi:hypothetical protein
MNDIKRFPASSYRPVEVSLARLNALSGMEVPMQVGDGMGRHSYKGAKRAGGHCGDAVVFRKGLGGKPLHII